MRSLIVPGLFTLLIPIFVACGGASDDNSFGKSQCHDGKDNDGDGQIDFPDDLGCTALDDDNESDMPSPQCHDGRDNDGDGKVDFPTDPGCFAPNQDDETDDCPDGPGCPQCSDGKDNDGNGQTDYPNDTGGCNAASDTDEYTQNPVACGSNVMIKKLPFNGHAMGMIGNMGASSLQSPMCGGAGLEDVYELRITKPKVVVATTDSDATAADTILYIRGTDCQNNSSEMVCNNDIGTSNKKSTITQSLSTPGTYYLVVDSNNTATGGAYDLSVKFLTGEGETCSGADDCGPGLVCRVAGGGTDKVCAKHVCGDTYDDDMDGKIGFPSDPGCTSADDDDESDGCASGPGPNCPECGDGLDNDGDGKTDYGTNGDTTCTSASSASEACVAADGVVAITTATVMGNTTGKVNDMRPTCASSSGNAPDLMYRLDVPAMATLNLETTGFDAATALYNSTCTGTAIACSDPTMMTVNNLAAGTYYFLVDGYSTGNGAFTINVSGKIQNNASCEGPLAQAGVITCGIGYSCAGNAGSRTCQPAQCTDGIDNDGDGKIDFPDDWGCTDMADNDETNTGAAPACSDGADNDTPTDGQIDWPADFGCASASGTSEAFCTGETDPASLITTTTTTGTTTGLANDQMPSCVTSSTAPEKTYALQLPVQVASLTIGSTGFDTVLSLKSANCATTVACDDEGGVNFGDSLITLANVAPGGYAVVVDGWSTNNGAFTLTVKGTVAPGTRCDSALFSGGANAVLACPANTTCQGTTVKKCM